MLKVKPKDRMGTDELLRHPSIRKRTGNQGQEVSDRY